MSNAFTIPKESATLKQLLKGQNCTRKNPKEVRPLALDGSSKYPPLQMMKRPK